MSYVLVYNEIISSFPLIFIYCTDIVIIIDINVDFLFGKTVEIHVNEENMETRGTIESPAKPFTITEDSGYRQLDESELSAAAATAVQAVERDVQGAEDDDEDEDDEEEEEEELEPRLKYERLGNDLSQILSKDAASALAVHPKFCALGTHWGVIHILDPQGNNIVGKEINAHTTTVNQITIDAAGDHIASCSDDGRVVITGEWRWERCRGR